MFSTVSECTTLTRALRRRIASEVAILAGDLSERARIKHERRLSQLRQSERRTSRALERALTVGF